MSKSIVLFDRFMSAKFLNDNAQWNCRHTLTDRTHLSITSDSTDYERIFMYKLVDKQSKPPKDLEIILEVGMEYTVPGQEQ